MAFTSSVGLDQGHTCCPARVARCFRGAAYPYMLRGKCWFLHGRDDAATAVDGEVTQRAPERMHPRVLEQIVDLAVPQIMEAPVEVLLSPSQERVQNRTLEQIVDFPVPRTIEAIVEVVPSPPQERVPNRTHEQIVDFPVPQLMETIVEVVPSSPKESVQNCTPEQIVDIPVPRTIEEIVEQISVVPQTTGTYGHVLRPVPSERIQKRLVDVGFIKGLDRYNMPRPGDVMVPVPQIREAALEVDAPQECVQDVAEQVIEVPEISLQNGNLQRASLQAPQLVEQLVEVPTVPFTVEQIIDNPVPGRGASGHGGLQDCLPEQSSTAFGGADHRIPSPVRGSRGGGPQGSRPEQSSTAFGGADHPFPSPVRGPRGGGPQGFRPGQDSTAFCGAERGSPQGFRPGQDSTAFFGAEHGSLHGVRDGAWVMVTTPEQRTYYWHWRDGTTRWRLPAGVRHGWVRVLSGYYVHVESQAETWMLPAFEG